MKASLSSRRGDPAAYALATLPFIAFFAYQLYVELPKRPDAPDVVRGYTIPMEINYSPPTRYISIVDFVKTFGSIGCGTAIMLVAAWRGGAFSRKKGGNGKSHK